MRLKLVAAAAAVVLAAAGGAAAAPPPAADLQPCLDDLQRLCPGLAGPVLRQCRNNNRAHVSAACRQALADHGLKLKTLRPPTP